MLSNKTESTGMKVSTFLRDEKRSCKQMQKQILKEMPAAIPRGKSFTVEVLENRASPGEPSVVARALWKEKRSGENFSAHIDGPPAHSVLLALTDLKAKAHEMARAQK